MTTSDPVERTLIDCHVHLAALPDGRNACHISPRILNGPLFRFLLWKHGLNPSDPLACNQRYLDELLRELRSSHYVRRAIVLGMDGVYDSTGQLSLQQTDFFINNDYVLEVAGRYPDDFLPGVSINPQRRDATAELERCAARGAVLVKVLPNTQGFDPANRAFIPFYQALARHRMPLLSHVGYEFSLIGRDQSAGDPDRLRLALDEGVTVIAAHGCSHGLMFYEKFYPIFLELVSRYPNFYADVSALTLPNRVGMLLRLRRHPELAPRLLFGTDYPLSVFHLPCWGRVPPRVLKQIIATRNRFDRKYLVLKSLGIGFRSFDQIGAAHS